MTCTANVQFGALQNYKQIQAMLLDITIGRCKYEHKGVVESKVMTDSAVRMRHTDMAS